MINERGHITPDTVTRAMHAMWDASYPTPRIIVAPDEAAWIKNPVGPAPTVLAVQLALGFGTVHPDHPDVRQMMSMLSDGPHLIGDRDWRAE